MSLQKIFCRSRNNWLLRVTKSLAGNVARRQDHPGKRSFLRAARRPWVQEPTRSRQATSAGRPSRRRSFSFWRARFRRLRHAVDPFKAGAQSATHAQLGGNCCRESAKSSAQHRVPRQNSMSLEGQERCIGRAVKGLLDPNHRTCLPRMGDSGSGQAETPGCHIAEFIPH